MVVHELLVLVVVCGQHAPPTSTHVTYLWGIVKHKFYGSLPHMIEELKENILR